MPVTHLGIVWNPAKVERSELVAALAAAVEDAGREPRVSWAETTEQDPGSAATAELLAAGAERIVAAGGDGTVRAVAQRLAEHEPSGGRAPELAIVPRGTGNLLARNLGVPIDDLDAAMRRALTGVAREIDLGWAECSGGDAGAGTGRRAFAVMAGFGIDAHMIVETDDDLKSRVGWLAYLESLGRAVSASEVIGLSLQLDDGPTEQAAAHTLLVGNCGTLQGGMTILPDADPADGRLDLLLLDAESVGGWLDTLRNLAWDNRLKRMLPRLGGGAASGATGEERGATGAERGATGATSSTSVQHRSARRMRVELEEPRVFELDGDEIGTVRRIEISVQPGALRVA